MAEGRRGGREEGKGGRRGGREGREGRKDGYRREGMRGVEGRWKGGVGDVQEKGRRAVEDVQCRHNDNTPYNSQRTAEQHVPYTKDTEIHHRVEGEGGLSPPNFPKHHFYLHLSLPSLILELSLSLFCIPVQPLKKSTRSF